MSGSLNLEELKYTPETDAELSKKAENSLKDYYLKAINEINDEVTRAQKDLDEYKSGLSAAAQQQKEYLDNAYTEAKKNVSDDALKRGLARSSIVVNKISALEDSKASEVSGVAAQLFDSVAKIDYDLAALESQREKALADFDISYAAKLENEIDELKEARQARYDEVVKYNNDLKKEQAKYELDYAKADAALDDALYERMKESIEGGLNEKQAAAVLSRKTDEIGSYLNGLDKSSAVRFLEENKDFFVGEIGVRQYENLYSQQQRR